MLETDEIGGPPAEKSRLRRPEERDELGERAADVIHRVVAPCLVEALGGPGRLRQTRSCAGVERRHFLAARKAQPLLGPEHAIVLIEVAFQRVLSIDGLLGADETEARLAQRHAIL